MERLPWVFCCEELTVVPPSPAAVVATVGEAELRCTAHRVNIVGHEQVKREKDINETVTGGLMPLTAVASCLTRFGSTAVTAFRGWNSGSGGLSLAEPMGTLGACPINTNCLPCRPLRAPNYFPIFVSIPPSFFLTFYFYASMPI
ncbi:hypothetical protein GYMLUDRAFT_728460 [Collybiopsis luxurians FD-317 M1]|nr:hypothetical protein GYMLUDRAFT_728460 [Collybiopsis luxurians FD-317 M1]